MLTTAATSGILASVDSVKSTKLTRCSVSRAYVDALSGADSSTTSTTTTTPPSTTRATCQCQSVRPGNSPHTRPLELNFDGQQTRARDLHHVPCLRVWLFLDPYLHHTSYRTKVEVGKSYRIVDKNGFMNVLFT